MSTYREMDGGRLIWRSLFSIQNHDAENFLANIKNDPTPYYSDQEFTRKVLKAVDLNWHADTLLQLACIRVSLNFMLNNSTIAEELLDQEEYCKAIEQYNRKQYNSKLLQYLLSRFYIALDYREKDFSQFFTYLIIDEIRKVKEEEINALYGPLKKVIDKVASGVKGKCYTDADKSLWKIVRQCTLDDKLNEYFIQKTNYDFNKANSWSNGFSFVSIYCYLSDLSSFKAAEERRRQEEELINDLLQRALLDDEKYWEEHSYFAVVDFLNNIVEQNDIRHAEKVLDLIIKNLQKMPHMELVYKNQFPLYASMYDKALKGLEDRAKQLTFKRLEQYCDLSAVKDVPLCYPMVDAEPAVFEIGKKVWEGFIKEYNYPNDYESVNCFLESEVQRFVAGETKEIFDIAVIFDSGIFDYGLKGDRRLFSAYHSDCFSVENIWKRVYIKAYATTLLSNDKKTQYAYLQRIFIDVIKTIERKLGVYTAHQLDMSAREKKYVELKKLLSDYGVAVNDNRKQDYIVALLDRDTALMEEAALFPELEQIGDAIYGLSVAELLFYNPDMTYEMDYNMSKRFENLIRAEAQVFISKKIGADKLYLHTGLPAKYVEFDTLYYNFETAEEERLQDLKKEKYLADSLEMIIGAVYRDCGIFKAMEFTKKLLFTAFPEQLREEVHPTDENKYRKDIDRDYWTKILPAPYSTMEKEHSTLWSALDKVILIYSLGTERLEEREYITRSFGNTEVSGDLYSCWNGVSWAFYEYLTKGLGAFLERYSEKIRDSYESKKIK